MIVERFYGDVDMKLHQTLNHVIEVVASEPTTNLIKGRIVYNEATSKLISYSGSQWLSYGNVEDINVDDSMSKSIADGVYTIGVKNASASTRGTISITDYNKLQSLKVIDDSSDIYTKPGGSEEIIGSGSTVASAISSLDANAYQHTGSGDPSTNRPHGELKLSEMDTDDTLGGALASNAKAASQLAIKTYIDNNLSSAGRPAEAYATGGVNVAYPSTYDGGAIQKGDQFIISDDGGSVGPATAINVNSNDTLIAKVDAATNAHADWTVITAAPILDADETTKGIQRNSTDAEAIAGTLANVTITPKNFKYILDNLGIAQEAKQSGSTDALTVSHGWNNRDVTYSAYINSSGVAISGAVTVSLNSVTMTLGSGEGANIGPWTLVVIGQDKS